MYTHAHLVGTPRGDLTLASRYLRVTYGSEKGDYNQL